MSNPSQLIILLKANVPTTPPSSLSSLSWSLVSMVLASKVTSVYSRLDMTNTACAASSTGIFTFVSQQFRKTGGFRYDPTLGSGAPPPPSTNNFQQSDQYWVNMSLNLGSSWTTSFFTNEFPKMFYVPVAGGSGGHNLVLSSLKENTVVFAQENQTRGFDFTGTLQMVNWWSTGRLFTFGERSVPSVLFRCFVWSLLQALITTNCFH